MSAGTALAEEFERHRATLLGAAYRVVGVVADAEDVVQETWLRWAAADRSDVRDVRAYLLRISTRLALNRLRQRQSRREDYVGPWLPEPIDTTDVAEQAELADSVSMAMLVVLETLSPLERAAFVLREVFDVPVSEVASTLDRSEVAVRQLTHRAREHVQARRPRRPVDPKRHDDVTRQFLQAAAQGDVESLVRLLAPEVVLVSDGGGLRKAALRPIEGRDKVVRFLVGVLRQQDPATYSLELVRLNGQLALVGYDAAEPDTVAVLDVGPQHVEQIFLLRHPDKLSALRS